MNSKTAIVRFKNAQADYDDDQATCQDGNRVVSLGLQGDRM